MVVAHAQLRFLWLEITGKCQLECTHCYADSGPTGTHGKMTGPDWHRVIEDAARLGVDQVQFIGGEPTLHPDLPRLVDHALVHRMQVEVFSNLVHVPERLWNVFARPGVSLATSWYSDDPTEHAAITRRPSHPRTAANVAEAVRRGIPLRVGIIGVRDGQRVDRASEALTSLGVPAEVIGYDDLRQVGRGVRDATPDVSQLCGGCADGVLAVSPSGEVWPCVFTRWMPVGNVLDTPLADILTGPATAGVRAELTVAFAERPCGPQCNPNCAPQHCTPKQPKNPCHPDCAPKPCQPTCAPRCSPSCNPCQPSKNCWPTHR